MKKIIIAVAAVFAVGLVAFAGFDQYVSKNYTTILAPQAVNANAVSNSVNSGVDISGLVGGGAIVFGYKCDMAAGSIIQFTLGTCASTNGTYTTYTNMTGASAWSYTNNAGFATVPFRPNRANRYLRVYATPTLVTNGSASAVLVTE